MTPIAKRPVLTESAPAEFDLTGNLGYGGLDRISGVVQDQNRPLDDDGAGGLEGQGDGGSFEHAEI
jgi:hypothetical protein